MNAFRLLALLLCLTFCPRDTSAAEVASPAGHWEGAIELPSNPLAIRVDLVAPKDGTGWSGSIDIPAQMLRGLALTKLEVGDDRIGFELAGIPGTPTFDGQRQPDGRIGGEFRQNGRTFRFQLERRAAAPAGDTPGRGVPGQGLPGHWQGSLRAGPVELRLVLHVQADPQGALTATLDSIDQGARDLPVSDVSLRDGEVTFALPKLGARYAGRMSGDGSAIEGQWQQSALNNGLVFRRLAEAPQLRRPQEPKPPFPYKSREVTFPGGGPGVTLAGTLTVPKGPGPFPAVALVTGSGPQDRDESLLGHKPFLVLADHLSRHGIAVLRFDDRGVGQSTGSFAAATHHDFAADARAAFAFLKAQPEVRAGAVGLCGHSEGGLHVSIAAAEDREVAFLVLLAGIGVKPQELLLRQRADFLRVTGLGGGAREAENRALTEEIFALARADGAAAAAREKIAGLYRRIAERYPEAQRESLGLGEAGIARQVATVTTPWFVELLRCDPAPTFARVRCPVLALNGARDIQVAAAENLAAIREGLAAGGNKAVETRELPELNHLFQHCQTGAVAEYGSIEETMSPGVLELVSNWIRQHADNPQRVPAK